MAFEMTQLIASSWAHYPERYKFIGLQINVKESQKVTHRQTYGLLEFGGEIGGNFEFIKVTGFLIARGLVTFNFLALIANRMYIWKPPTQDKSYEKKLNPSSQEHEIPFEAPRFLEFWSFLSNFCCRCCLKKTAWVKYKEALKKVEFDIDMNLDITVVLRRLRMHGLVLNFLLTEKQIKGFIDLTENKPIQYIDITKPQTRWDQLEAMGKWEKLSKRP